MTPPASDLLLVEQHGPVLRVTLNRPDKLNAINRELHDALTDVWPAVGRGRDTAVVVLTGAGRAFSAGGDVGEFTRMQASGEERRQMAAAAQAIVLGMLRCPVPIVAAVNGPAIGLGCSLALLSDVVVMAETAFLADTHVQHGLVPGDTADEIAHRIASMPRGAVQDTKRMLNLYIERSITGVMDFAMAAERLNFADRRDDDAMRTSDGAENG